ncbi:retroviral-like aspartic protease family protein [Roseibacterium beibuensis]|uniref:retroviral-like aspartic protease family protein n=1 Tax=[Roseibacterium] beibuensis TaxID=1193142 RepID=UPI00217F07CD|nr:retroviral-like aspartic protease family protein [Roseibacterium beibuensis]MCS6624577.1 retroviral-like aspartic protease family protein [Roseibacterium beibuensis]
MAALAGLGPGFVCAQDEDDGEPRLLANLLTRMALRVTINGRRGAVFVLDTGAGRTVISEDLAWSWNLPPRAPVLVHGLTAAQVAPTVHINRLSVGGRRINDLEAPVFPRAVLAADGLIGLDVLGRFRLDLNIAARRVRMRPSGPDVVAIGSAGHRATRLPTQERSARHGRFGTLILPGVVDGREVDVFVDTGAQYSIGNLALLRSIGGDPAGLQRITVYGVTGQVLAAASGQVRDLRLGTQRLGPTPLLFADLHAFGVLDLIERPALLIGADLLYRFREVTLDFGRSRMAFRGLRRLG